MNKYAFTGKTKDLANGTKVHQIRALKDIGLHVKAGDIGGWIESEHNLSHEGDCWVTENAVVCGCARVFENARICDSAMIRMFAKIHGNAVISSDIIISTDANISSGRDFLHVGPIGYSNDFFTFYHTSNDDIHVYSKTYNLKRNLHFIAPLKHFIRDINEQYKEKKILSEYKLIVDLAKSRLLWRDKNRVKFTEQDEVRTD